MRWCRYVADGTAAAGAGPRYGIVTGDRIVPVDGDPFDANRPGAPLPVPDGSAHSRSAPGPSTAGESVPDRSVPDGSAHSRPAYVPSKGGGYRVAGEPIALDRVRLLPPVVPGTFYAVGFNYADHVRRAGRAMPERPEVGYRAASALTGHGAPIVRPADCHGAFEAEGELVAVLGTTLRHATREQARAAVLGWTIGNDVSAREWQRADRTFWRAKNSDTFKPMGPWLDTGADPLAATTTVSVNGEVRASFRTGAMIFDPYDYLVEMSRYITLWPGDVLWMGADGGVPIDAGDVVEVTIDGLGTLRNPVVAESPIPEPAVTEEEHR